eukprot:3099815-Prymnesium_polylepis.1
MRARAQMDVRPRRPTVPAHHGCSAEILSATEKKEKKVNESSPQTFKGHTLTFRIGTIRPNRHNEWVDVVNTFLPGKVVNFRCSSKHESIYVDGTRYGTRAGRLLESCQMGVDDRIETLTIGLSTSSLRNDWGGGMVANFNNLSVREANSGERRSVHVNAELIRPDKLSWTFDRQKLGLELWLTGVSLAKVRGAKELPVAYTFTLASPSAHVAAKHGLSFNVDEFRRFWDWLTLVRQCEQSNRLPLDVLAGAALDASAALAKDGASLANVGASVVGDGLKANPAMKAAQGALGNGINAVGGATAVGAGMQKAKEGFGAVGAASSGAVAAASGAKDTGFGVANCAKMAGGQTVASTFSMLTKAARTTPFVPEKPTEEEDGPVEGNDQVADVDRDHHIAKFGQKAAARHSQTIDRSNPFTVATWGGYSAIIVRHGPDVAPILFSMGAQVEVEATNFDT